jgi:DNA-binding NtrC family response regulator
MENILLCSHNPILIKNIYGILRDDGNDVEIADHPSHAVQMVLKKSYAKIIIDSEPFGLSVEDAIKIIKTISPEIVVIIIGYVCHDSAVVNIEEPINLEEFKRTIHELNGFNQIA